MALDRASVVKKAEAFVREGKLDQAAAQYRALLDDHPGDSSAANALGDLYARLGDPARAIEQYTNLGESEWVQGFSAKAAAFYKKALKVDQNCESALVRLGEIAASQSLFADATRHWTRLGERRRLRGDAAGEAEVAGWLADLQGARSTRRQATSVGMTPRVEPSAIAVPAAEPAPAPDSAPAPESARTPEAAADAQPAQVPAAADVAAEAEAEPPEETVPWEAALLAAPSETTASMAATLAAMPADSAPLVVEQFGQLSVEVPAGLVPDAEPLASFEQPFDSSEPAGGIRLIEVPIDPDAAHLVELGQADVVAGATAFASEKAPAAETAPDTPDDWEIVVDLGDDIDATATLDDAELLPATAASEAPEIFEVVDGDGLTGIAGAADMEAVEPMDGLATMVLASPVPTDVPGEPAGSQPGADAALIAELVAAADTPNLRFQAAVQLGRIFLQNGDLGRGIEWLERACVVTPPVRDHGLLARYDLADALERAGDHTRALDVLSDLEMDAGSYRDVSARITRLSRATGSAP